MKRSISLSLSLMRLERLTEAAASKEEAWNLLREIAKTNLYFLCKAVLQFKDLTPSFHGPLCFLTDQVPMGYSRGLDLWPRGHLKTHILTFGRSIQEYLNNHEIRICLASSSKDNAMKNLRKIKNIFEFNGLLHWLFPECIPDLRGKWAETQIVLPRKTNPPEPTFHCVGVGGHITGYHFDVIRKDDLIDEKTEKSPEVMEKIIDWHLVSKNLLESPTAGADHLIGTRWSCGDLYQYVIDSEPEYSITTIPAIGPGTRRTRAGTTELRFGPVDKPNWPERFKLEALHDLRIKEPYQYACQQMNNPRDAAIVDFNAAWLRYYSLSANAEDVLIEATAGG
jgi:hypothetical protein